MALDHPFALDYLDFELLIGHGQAGEYPVSVIRSPAGELAHEVLAPFPSAGIELEDFLGELPFILIRSSGAARRAMGAEAEEVRRFGQQLFNSLFSGEIGQLYRASQIEAHQQGTGLRLKLRIRPAELAALPWEFLFDPEQNDYVSLSRYSPIIRYLEVEHPLRPLDVEPPLRILGWVANPRGTLQVEADQEKRYLTEALQDLTDRGLVQLTWWSGQTWQALQAAMRAGPWHIFHFIGHGSFPPGAAEGSISLADEADQPFLLPASNLARLLIDHRSLRVVILNACQGSQSDRRNPFSSTATTLVRRGMPAVLAMQYPITDSAALHFGRGLYQALASWLPIEAAVSEARKAVRLATSSSLEWGTATLYLRAPSGRLFAPIPSTPDQPSPPLCLNNLPPRYEFIGRDDDKARLQAALRSRSPIISVEGLGGMGKTSLVLEVAHECLRASRLAQSTTFNEGIVRFAGIVWMTAKDSDLTLNDLLDTIAQTLGRTSLTRLAMPEKRVAIRQLLQTQPYLVILDNYETVEDEDVRRFLLDLPEPSKGLVTTREQSWPEAQPITLRGLSRPEALTLMRSEGRRLGLTSLVRLEDKRLSQIYEVTGGAPLAIKWAVGQIKQKGQSLETVQLSLQAARGDLFAAMFDRSWALLSSDARQLLQGMPVLASAAAHASLQAASGLNDDQLEAAIGQLLEMSLLEATDDLDVQFSLHPLTRAYAAARLRQSPGAEAAAVDRLAEYYAGFTAKYGGFWTEAGFNRLESELPNIVSILQRLWAQARTSLAAAVFNHVIDFLLIQGYWLEVMSLGQLAAAQALQAGDELNAARAQVRALAWVERHRGELDAAEVHLQSALPVFERLGEQLEWYYARRNLGRVAGQRGDWSRAQQILSECLTYFQAIGDRRHIYLTTANLAKVALDQGDLATAWSLCDGVLAAAREFDDPERIASLLKVMGSVAWQRGDLVQAKGLWTEGLQHAQRANRLDEIADAHYRLAQVELALHNSQAARPRLLVALEICRKLDLTTRIAEIEKLLSL